MTSESWIPLLRHRLTLTQRLAHTKSCSDQENANGEVEEVFFFFSLLFLKDY